MKPQQPIDRKVNRGAAADSDAVPLRVGLVVFVSLVLNHSVAADANVWPGHLHPIESDPATQTDEITIRGGETGGTKGQEKS